MATKTAVGREQQLERAFKRASKAWQALYRAESAFIAAWAASTKGEKESVGSRFGLAPVAAFHTGLAVFQGIG